MNWKIVFTMGLLLSNIAFISYFFYQSEVSEQAPVQLTKNKQTETAKKLPVSCLSKTKLVKDLKHNMTLLVENNHKLEKKFSSINNNLEWYQDYINPIVSDHGSTLTASAKISGMIPGLSNVSDTVAVLTKLGRNISYYSNLMASAQRKNSTLHDDIAQFIKDESPQTLPRIKQEIKVYKKQTDEVLENLEQILPTLTSAKNLIAQSEGYSKTISDSFSSLFSDKSSDDKTPKTDNPEETFEKQFNDIHQEIDTVNRLLKNSYQQADEINMTIFILNKYQKTLGFENI